MSWASSSAEKPAIGTTGEKGPKGPNQRALHTQRAPRERSRLLAAPLGMVYFDASPGAPYLQGLAAVE